MKNKIIMLLESLLISATLTMNLNYQAKMDIPFVTRNPMITVIVFIGIYQIIKTIKKDYIKTPKKVFFIFLSLVISSLQLISHNYTVYKTLTHLNDSSFQIIKTIIFIIGYTAFIYYIILGLLKGISFIKYKKANKKIIIKYFDNHPVRNNFIVILIIYLISFALFFPGNTAPDYYDEIYQYNNLESFSVSIINLKNENQYINSHHSAFHTYIIGTINKIGINISNQNLGLALNAIVQILFYALILAYTFKLFKELKINYWFRFIILLVYLFLPIFVINSFTIYKDAPFAMALILFSCVLIEICYLNKKGSRDLTKLIISALLMFMLSKKGLYILMFTSIALFITFIKNNKRIAFFMLGLLIIGCLYDKILYNVFDVTPGSSREVLAIPIQQINRTVKYHDKDLKQEEKDTINKIIEYDKIKDNYNPEVADNIKNFYFNKDYTKNEMKDFLKTYVLLFFKYPSTYIAAFLNQTSGYTYLNSNSTMVYWNLKDTYIKEGLTDYSKTKRITAIDDFIIKMFKIIIYIPGVSMLFNMGAYFWLGLLMILLSIKKGKLKESIPFIPLLISILLLFVSPVNSNPRYVMPIGCLVIVLSPYFVKIYNERIKEEKSIKE